MNPLRHCFPLTITKSKKDYSSKILKSRSDMFNCPPVSWIKHLNKMQVLYRAHWHEESIKQALLSILHSSPQRLILSRDRLSSRYSNDYRWNGRTCWGLSGEDRKVHRCQSQRSRVSILRPWFMPGHAHPRDFKWKSWHRIIVLTGG